MKLTNTYKQVAVADIVIDREARQRREIKTEGLKDSILRLGVLNPIIITRENVLVAGERRLTSCRELGLPTIPCRYVDELSELEHTTIELEENLKRSDLSWQDTTRAIVSLYNAYLKVDENWNYARMGDVLGMHATNVSRYMRVGRELHDPKIAQIADLSTAFNLLKRRDERTASDALSGISLNTTAAITQTAPLAAPAVVTSSGEEGEAGPELDFNNPAEVRDAATLEQIVPATPILNVDFTEWVTTYTGQPFNFIHCDFPYGINVFKGEWANASRTDDYADEEDVYWNLIKALAGNLDKVMGYSAHMMFWFSMEHYTATFEAFASLMPSLVVQKFPLIWHKSDNVGIMPDPRRQPRRIYETCLIATREDRPLVRSVSNTYACPTDKAHHPSTKPEPMLRHFMQMFVDTGTRMLDPTCGGGSALRAAESLHASEVLGLERDPEHFANATRAFKNFRAVRSLSV